MTPHSFYEKVVKPCVNLNDWVELISDARHPFDKWYAVEWVATTLGEGETAQRKVSNAYYNVSTEVMKEAILNTIDKERCAIWFTADINTYAAMNRAMLIMPREPNPLTSLFGTELLRSKSEMYRSGSSIPNHAMLFIAAHSTDKEITKWRVENSWGTKSLAKGHLTMSSDWFDYFIGCVAVPKSVLKSKSSIDTFKKESITWLPYWDVYGPVAKTPFH